MKKFMDSVVWITGASSGIGKSLAYAFSDRGARIIMSSRNLQELERVKNNCRNPMRHLIMPLDLEMNDGYEKMAGTIIEDWGKIDILCNVGGVSQYAGCLDIDPKVERKILETNYFGQVALTRAALPSMIKRRSGHIIVVTSLMGKFGPPMRAAYAASKHALHGYFDSLRAELSRWGIKVTLVCPGFVNTNISINYLDEQGRKHGHMDEDHANAISSEKCAEIIIRAVEKNRNEINIGGLEVMGAYLKRFFPNLLTRILANYEFKRGKVDEATR